MHPEDVWHAIEEYQGAVGELRSEEDEVGLSRQMSFLVTSGRSEWRLTHQWGAEDWQDLDSMEEEAPCVAILNVWTLESAQTLEVRNS